MVEICISVVGEVAAKVTGCLLDPITRQFGYLFNYRRNITDLNQKFQSLHLEKERLQIDVDAANRQGYEIYSHVREWLTYAEGIIQNRDDFNEDEKKASKSCFYFKSRHGLSKRAKRDAVEIAAKINEARDFGDRVFYRPHPTSVVPFISSSSFKDYEALESRESTFNQIMEALRNEEMRMIGVWGMGGVGKTTLVKQVAKQAEEQKLFHKVIIVLDITEKPDISEIQGRIASQFGSKLEEAEDRAARVRNMLKKVEKILVILDDIWGKLDLGKIGIPHDGDDHNGCKLLLTSREQRVLDTDMCTQKPFHLRHLNEEEAWNLFKRTAGDCVESPDLQSIAINIVKKCDGLPVAIVTIANALKKESPPVWKNALEELRRSAPTNIRGVSKNVYSCLELSYKHLEGDEVKSLFLLCGLLGVGDISMDHLLQYAMGLNLFKGLYSCEKAANKLITLVEKLKVSSLLLDNEDGDSDIHRSKFLDHAFVIRMHDVVRDVARSIASKDPHRFVVKEGVELQEWQRTDECRNCSRMSLMCRNMDELAQGLVCPQLEFFLLNSSNDDYSYLKIPDDFFLDTKQLRVLGLYSASLALSPSSFGFLSNLQTLCLNKCKLQDIAVIGKLKRLQILNLSGSNIERLPKEMMELSDLRVLDLQYCYSLRVIPRNVISSLSQLEYLSMYECSLIKWEPKGFNSRERNNACLSELKHLSGLRTLEVEVLHLSLLPKDDVVFDNLINLTRYSIAIGSNSSMLFGYKATRRLLLELDEVESFQKVKSFSNLLKKSQCVHLGRLKDTKDVVYELDKDSFEELEYLRIYSSPAIHSIPCNAFAKESFVNLRVLRLEDCARLKYVFSLPPNGRESDFPQLQSLLLDRLSQLISFYSIGSGGGEESTTLFNQKVYLAN